jgi:CrcB protein
VSATAWVGFLAAAAAGGVLRFVLDRAIGSRVQGVFPWGTFVINTSGSLVLGLVTGLALYHGFPATPKVILGTGFCGSYTTFSTFSFETVRLVEENAITEAFRNAIGTLVVAGLAAAVGIGLAAL